MSTSVERRETSSIPAYSWYVLLMLFLVAVSNYIDRQILSILMESIKADLSLNDTQLGFLTGTTFAIFYATFGVPLARLADRWSRRNVLVISLTVWSGMTAICGLAQNFVHLLLARTAVAIGEAGCTPPSHSMITDLFPKDWRVRAITIFSLGLPVGILLGLAFGGWINEQFNWRVAFMIVGAPGVLIAIVFMLTVREPPRSVPPSQAMPVSTLTAFKTLWAIRSYRHIAIASSLNAFASYGIAQWTPTFFIRSHGMGTAELGLYLGLVIGVSGVIGMFAGGWLAEKLGRINARWYVLVPAIALLISAPFYVAAYFAPTAGLALVALTIPSILNSAYVGPVFASVQSLSPASMRALSAALLLLMMNLIGLGLGPQAVGFLSDLLSPYLAEESLRWAMLLAIAAKAWSCVHYWWASRTLGRDIQAAELRGA